MGKSFRNCRKRNVQKAAFLIWRQKLYPDLQHMDRDISSERNERIWKKLSVFRQTNRLRERLCHTVVLRWLSRLVQLTDISQAKSLHEIFTKYHKTHNQGVFDIYTPEMKKARSQQDHHRSSGYLRKRTYRRRLPSCCICTVSIS